jgi:hyaluronoglucosaminidase
VRLFAVKFDDEGFAVTPESELRHGRFAPALVNYLKLVRQGLRRRDADARLYLLPQTYWWNDSRLDVFAASLRAAGGLDEDVGLVFTGPEIVSTAIDADGLAAARRAFGLTETKALLYDNIGREGDWGPLVGRGADLARYADGVFGERGTPLNRLTRLDWLWNPEGYDAEKSWRRAVLELAGPRDFARFEAICRAFRDGAKGGDVAALIDAFANSPDAAWNGPIARKDLVALIRGDVARLAGPTASTGHAGVAPAR